MNDIEEKLRHMPKWGWVALVAGIGVILWLQNRSSGGGVLSATGSPLDTTLPTGPTGGTSGPCPTYSTPSCPPGDIISYTHDENGCPQPVCSPPGSGPTQPPSPTPLQCASTPLGRTYTVGSSFAQSNGNYTTLRQVFNRYHPSALPCALLWNATAINRGLDGTLWNGFAVNY